MFQHNALCAICPATVNIIMGVISHSKANTEVRCTAIKCFVMMVQMLNKSSPEQVGIHVSSKASDRMALSDSLQPPLTYVIQPKLYVPSEDHHCQDLCEHSGQMAGRGRVRS
jgi:hypothetical protein